ncbi:hypothetical protein ACROYT_G040811 [Oculina patagonica]
MWKRLDEKYGDPAKVADVIMCAIQNMKPIREGESKIFVELINVIYDGYRDLKRLGLEKEITTTSSMSIIERKLPNDVKREWAKLVSSEHSPVDKRDKFPSLLRFLLEQKQAIEYENAELRSSSSLPLRGSLHYLEKRNDKVAIPEEQGSSRYKRTKCLYHEGANHWTNECRLYLSKPVQERLNTLKERGACWSCLRRGHRTQECRGKKPCGVNDCKRFHHKTLHEEEQNKGRPTDIASASGSASVCNNNEIETCLLQIYARRSTSRIPNGPFTHSTDPRRRFEFIQMVTDNFWKKWTGDHFPSLLIQQKWHTAHRNLKVGDVVLIQDSNLIRSQWKLGKVSKRFEGQDGKVRKVQVQYKNPKPGEPVLKYNGRGYFTIERPVNKLVVLLLNDEERLSK